MKIELHDDPDPALIDFLSQRIVEFNMANWEVTERLPLAVTMKDDNGNVLAGASGRTFGDWLLLERLWVDESLRGQHIGSRLLNEIERVARQRGCTKCLLDTLNFQARPFYEKHGYDVQWAQQGYPRTGCKYFMVKTLA
ncbi:GNAT family N-acetyltransferase [Alteromonas sp. CYL-A6]|uniref:GNAT family N-acetyltransferase n=1 Tax=Alteromonas nitratireducens TaxID=3390813 RepID=UPI0034AF66E8